MANEKRLIDANALLEKLSRMIDYCKNDNKVSGLTALFQVGDAIMDCPTVIGMDEKTYQRIMNRMFLSAEGVCGEDMVYLETIGDIIREECKMDGDENAVI